MKHNIRENIILSLYNNFKQGGKGLTEPELISMLGKKKEAKGISKELQAMKQYKALNCSKLRYSLNNIAKYHEGTVVKVARGHGFILLNDSEEGEEVFVRGRDFMGALPGDKVLLKIIADKDENNRSCTAVVAAVW